MKRKGLVKKAVLPALVALVCSVIALTSVSYAWFTIGNTAQVDDIQMNVQAADGLQVSATGNANDFKSILNTTELKKEGTSNTFPAGTVVPVSTVAAVTADGKLTFYKGTITNGVLSATADTANYICFDIYVQASNAKTLYLETSSSVLASNNDKETHLASRVAFIDLGSAETAKGAQDLTGATTNPVVIWEPNSTTRSEAYQNAYGTGNNDKQMTYNGISSVNGEGVPTLSAVSASDNTSNLAICSLEAGYNRIRVYVWLEGQDVDCLNEISGGGFIVNLDLKYGE